MTVIALASRDSAFALDLRHALLDLGAEVTSLELRALDRADVIDALARVSADAVVHVCGDEVATAPGGGAVHGSSLRLLENECQNRSR